MDRKSRGRVMSSRVRLDQSRVVEAQTRPQVSVPRGYHVTTRYRRCAEVATETEPKKVFRILL